MTGTTPALPSVIREVEVAAPLATCFKVFVDGFDTWWPREHHLGEDRDVVEFRIEPEVGGRCYVVDRDGGVSHWGTRFSDVIEGRTPLPVPTPAG